MRNRVTIALLALSAAAYAGSAAALLWRPRKLT
jgi:hypothetical protein